MKRDMRIVELMRKPSSEHDECWLKKALHAAAKLEFATIPPYLAAYWSVKKRTDPVAKSIRTIVVDEEMLHLALLCNMLVAVGETPQLNTADGVPTYPGPMPGGVHPGLEVPLQGLSIEAAKLFMEIEYPENGPVKLIEDETFPTIGTFYSAIAEAFGRLKPPLDQKRQLEGPLDLRKLGTVKEVLEAVELIKHQGEGSHDSPEDTGPDDLAHYYRFGEIHYQKRMKKDEVTGKWTFSGDPVPFPDVWPMARVPFGGYAKSDVTPQVWQLLEKFDANFTSVLNQLQAAWQDGSSDSLDQAVGAMGTLRRPAVDLMQIPIPATTQTYGPCFRLVQPADSRRRA